jgi:hypothetical protein
MNRFDILLGKSPPPSDIPFITSPANKDAFISPNNLFQVIGARRIGKTEYLWEDLMSQLIFGNTSAIWISCENSWAPRSFGGKDIMFQVQGQSTPVALPIGQWRRTGPVVRFRNAGQVCMGSTTRGTPADLVYVDDMDHCLERVSAQLFLNVLNPYFSAAKKVMISSSHVIPHFEHWNRITLERSVP